MRWVTDTGDGAESCLSGEPLVGPPETPKWISDCPGGKHFPLGKSMNKALLMLVVHTIPLEPSLTRDDFQTLDRWTELMLSVRRVMNSRLLSVPVYIVVGGLFCTLLLEARLPTRRAAITVLYVGLFLNLVGAAFCFNLAGFNPTRTSRAFLSVWGALVAIAFFEFGWKHLAVAIILYTPYFLLGRVLSALFVVGVLRHFVQREKGGGHEAE